MPRACATFLYNLRLAVQDIRSGRARVAIVGAAEAPVVAEVMEGYAAMGALASDKALRALDGLAEDAGPDLRRACRPFAENCGFTMAESAQLVVLFDDALALELGAPVLGSVPDVFVSADGPKKSISGPGVGNFVTFAKAAALLRDMLDGPCFANRGMVQAHGTSTPQNRVTESEIMSRVAGAMGVHNWTVGAIKSFIGHSLGAAAGDQLSAVLGIWDTGIMPGITTIDAWPVTPPPNASHPSKPARRTSPPMPWSARLRGQQRDAAVGPDATTIFCPASGPAVSAWQHSHDRVQQSRADIEAQRLTSEWAPSTARRQVMANADVQPKRRK